MNNYLKSVCIRCGSFKREPWGRCSKCDFTPDGDDLVKSVYCSTGRFSEDPERACQYLEELKEISNLIKNNQEITYNQDEINRLKKERNISSVSNIYIFRYLLKVFMPAIILLVILLIMILIRFLT